MTNLHSVHAPARPTRTAIWPSCAATAPGWPRTGRSPRPDRSRPPVSPSAHPRGDGAAASARSAGRDVRLRRLRAAAGTPRANRPRSPGTVRSPRSVHIRRPPSATGGRHRAAGAKERCGEHRATRHDGDPPDDGPPAARRPPLRRRLGGGRGAGRRRRRGRTGPRPPRRRRLGSGRGGAGDGLRPPLALDGYAEADERPSGHRARRARPVRRRTLPGRRQAARRPRLGARLPDAGEVAKAEVARLAKALGVAGTPRGAGQPGRSGAHEDGSGPGARR